MHTSKTFLSSTWGCFGRYRPYKFSSSIPDTVKSKKIGIKNSVDFAVCLCVLYIFINFKGDQCSIVYALCDCCGTCKVT